VVTRPIKGTRARGAHAAEDARLAAELLASEKDRAEHVMIVDVERNDLGRVAVAGGVSVDELAAIETFASVHHLTSTVSARLRSGVRTSDLLRATFPSGSISGAPKLRAMEIIDQVEPVRRSVYTGAIGWFGFGGDCQLSMGIRILLAARGRLHLWAGGGIVADSRVEEEYEETLVKGRALARAIGADLDATVEAAR
jgi:para-aminobenzoate synthetase component 1